jgi:hypothetical protein
MHRLSLLVLALASPAAARTVAAPELQTQGPIDDAARAFFAAGMLEGAEASGCTLVAPKALKAALAERPDLASCDVDRCLLSLASSTGAQAIVLGRIAKEAIPRERERARYEVRLRLYDAGVAEFTSVEEEPCPRCTEPELQALVKSVTRRLFERERHPETAPLEVVSVPARAEVRVDGRLIGLTDLAQPLAAGGHQLAVEKEGLPPARAELSLAPGRAWRVAVRWPEAGGAPEVTQGLPTENRAIAEAAVPPVAVEKPRRLQRPVGAAVGVVGVAAAIAGIALLAINGQGTCAGAAMGEVCPMRWATGAPGGVALGAGLLALGVGITMLIIDPRF